MFRPRRGLLRLFALGCAASACGQPLDGVGHPPPPARISPSEARQELAGHFSVLHDPSGKLTITDVTRAESAAAWRLCRASQVGFGYTPDTYWVQLVLENTAREAIVRILEMPGTLDALELYAQDGQGRSLSASAPSRAASLDSG